MSNIVSENSVDFSQETTSADGGMDFVGQQNEANIINIKGDFNVGVTGGSLNDEITTGAGDADVFAGDGEDIIKGGIGDDTFRGGMGNDEIFGGIGADTLIGGQGNDILVSGRGKTVDEDGNLLDEPIGDVLKGGAGDDIFRFVADEIGTGVDTILDFKDDGFADTIRIFGVGEDATVSYENGVISVNGEEVVDIGTGKEITQQYNEQTESWDLF